jgi:hypothetical protein
LRRSALVAHASDARVALLERLFDHAPLFPPASLPLGDAIREDERAQSSAASFALGRLVWPAARFAEAPLDRELSVVLDGSFEPDARVAAVEVPPRGDVDAAAALADEVYVEVPLDDELDQSLAVIEASGLRAKVRCSADEAGHLPWFLLECRARGIVFKATAGLHHALSTGAEYGFLNLLAAVVFEDDAALREAGGARFEVTAETFRWGDRSAGAEQITDARGRFHSIGTCSFFEPLEELERLGILPL